MWTFTLHPHPNALFLLDGLFVERPPTDRGRSRSVGRSPAMAPPATDAAADATASEAARSLARPREEEENSTRGEETSKVPFGAHHFTAGRRLLVDNGSRNIFLFLANMLPEP